ncbi:MAG: YebC/PmpR family DNA-binding transcriptional regulator [Patescibacteria group bacterium]|nr:YebC/PmpR family DNA-binding transcriptional regulator [Patescibacteria group bacterium]MDD5295098.1 YebC/PmpR family DNA-binding transcriptional regulator [Patescibacteria group bacterium]MDD5554081.1 YebC/PmpR family DNA-binding transcriptional regulator [Patescibacteria group bacterium]
MSGHSKWATTKRAKAAVDAKRGAIFTKIANLITIAAREKGGDPDTNFTLRMAVEKAKQANMPKDNIARAIKRGTGEGGGQEVAELIYEGFGPAKSQFIVKCLTDNRNRASASIRHLFSKHGGAFGAVAWNFEKKGVIRILKEEIKNANIKLEDLELNLIDMGAQDFLTEEEGITIYTKIEDLQALKKFMEEKNIKTETADIEFIAKESQEITGEDKEKIEKFIGELEDNEDTADYYHNISNI